MEQPQMRFRTSKTKGKEMKQLNLFTGFVLLLSMSAHGTHVPSTMGMTTSMVKIYSMKQLFLWSEQNKAWCNHCSYPSA